MPDWTKAEECVRARIACESTLPQQKDPIGDGMHETYFLRNFAYAILTIAHLWGLLNGCAALACSGDLGCLRRFLANRRMDKKGDDASKWEQKNKRG